MIRRTARAVKLFSIVRNNPASRARFLVICKLSGAFVAVIAFVNFKFYLHCVPLVYLSAHFFALIFLIRKEFHPLPRIILNCLPRAFISDPHETESQRKHGRAPAIFARACVWRGTFARAHAPYGYGAKI